MPPICLVPKTILHVLYCNAAGKMIVPKWPSSAFRPLLFGPNYAKKDYVYDIIEFDQGQNIFRGSSTKKCIFSSRRFASKTLVVRFVPRC